MEAFNVQEASLVYRTKRDDGKTKRKPLNSAESAVLLYIFRMTLLYNCIFVK